VERTFTTPDLQYNFLDRPEWTVAIISSRRHHAILIEMT